MPDSEDKTVIGYLAVHLSQGFLCHGDACIIADTEAAMQGYIEKATTQARKFRVKPVYFASLVKGLDTGSAYALEKNVYTKVCTMEHGKHPLFKQNKPANVDKRLGFVLIRGG